jgi:hypothetical protein
MTPPPRKPTPGAGQYAFVDTEEPTRPGVPKPSDRFDTLARLMANLEPSERADLLVLADCWYRCPADERVLLGALAAKLAVD